MASHGNQEDYADRCISSLQTIKATVPSQHPIRKSIQAAIDIFKSYKNTLPPVPDTGTKQSPPTKK